MNEAQEGRDVPVGLSKEKANLYYSVFNNPNGRLVIEDLVSQSGFFSDTFSADPYVHAYNAGFRRFVGRIINLTAQGGPIEKAEKLQFKKDKQ